MNIFEMIVTNNPMLQSIQAGLTHTEHNWRTFRAQLQSLMILSSIPINDLINKGQFLWNEVCSNTPEVCPVMINYYQFQLEKFIQHTLKPSLNEQTVKKVITTLQIIYKKHYQYANIFKPVHLSIVNHLQTKIINLVEFYSIPSKLIEIIWSTFLLHCRTILDQNNFNFSQNIKQYVFNRCEKMNKIVLNENQLQQCLVNMHNMGLSSIYCEQIINNFNKDCWEFIKNINDENILGECLKYSKLFHHTFLQKIQSLNLIDYLMLENNIYLLCGKHCAGNILDIILCFPQSGNMIQILRRCLQRTDLVEQIADELLNGVQNRLLIPGVITDNILTQYINVLKVLQIIDPHGIIFERITQPIKNYLLKRNDTLRCIINQLTQDNDNYEKLTRQVVRIHSHLDAMHEISSQQENASPNSHVEISTYQQQYKTKIKIRYQQSDLVTVLVNLYGSQQAFISQYQNMMAEKFISLKQYNLDQEITNIQLLKKRFGEAALQTCNIIIKDIKDSKRNDNVIHKDTLNNKSYKSNQLFDVQQMHCLAVSKGFWPINYDNTMTFQLPGVFQQVFDEYSACFSKIKVMRKISFHFNLGHVNLKLSFNNGSFQFKCLPLQAIMITYFDENNIKDPSLGISSEQLSHQLHISQVVVKQKMSFWVHKGVVRDYRIPRIGLSLRKMNSMDDGDLVYYKPVDVYHEIMREEIDDMDIDNAIMKESTSMESHLRHIIQGLIISILNINGPKPPQKIHLLLKTVYKTDLDYAYQQAQTIQILRKMVQKKKIFYNGQNYSSKSQ